MKDYKNSSEEFKSEMGFKSCDLNPSKVMTDDRIFVQNMEKIKGVCDNIKGDKYNCITYFDINTNKIIKSDCEKEE